jgi:hypothetical protein
MTIYELYEQVLDDCWGTYKYDKRVGVFVNKDNALKFKEKWEKQWVENGKRGISPCYMDARQYLIIKEIQTND